MDNNQLEDLQRAIDEFNSGLRGMSTNMSGLSKAEIQAKQDLDRYRESLNKAKDAQHAFVNKYAQGTINFAKSAQSSANSFDVLKDTVSGVTKVLSGIAGAVPFVGGAFKALGEAAGELTKMMIDQFGTGWAAYKDLADIGLASSFEDMKDSAASAGLLFQDLSKSVGKYSTDLSNLGAGTAQGMKKFREVSAVLEDQRGKYARMGIGIDEFTEYQAKFMAQETRQGRARNMTAEQLAKGTTDYIDQLDMLSKLTGASRKDLQSQRDAAQSETKFASATELMEPGIKKMFEDMNVLIANKGGPSLAQGFRDLTSGSVSTDAAKQLILQSGGAANDIVEKIRNGSVSVAQGFTELQKSMKQNLVPMAEIGQHIGDGSLYTKSFAELRKMVNAGTITEEDMKNAEKQQEKLKAGTDATVKQTAALADTTQKLYSASSNLQLLMTNSDMVAKGMEKVSGAIDDMSIKMLDFAGVELPEDLKARRELRKAMAEEKKARQELTEAEANAAADTTGIDWGASEMGGQGHTAAVIAERKRAELTAAEERVQKAQGRVNATKVNATKVNGSAGDTQPQPQKTTVDAVMAALKSKESGGGYSAQNPTKGSTASGGFQFIDATWKKLTEQHGIGQEYKSAKQAPPEVQDAVARKYVEDILRRANGDVSKVPLEWYTGNQQGKMTQKQLDANNGVTADQYQSDWMNRYKKFAPVSGGNDTQVKARDGWDGTFDGPDSGYNPNLELHKKERVTITPATDNTNEKMLSLLETMVSKYDTIIELLDDGNGHSKKIAVALT